MLFRSEMSYHDPYCPSMKMDEGGVVESQPLTAEVISEQDLIIITTGHKKKVDYDLILEHSSTVFDTRYVLSDKADGEKAQVVFL